MSGRGSKGLGMDISATAVRFDDDSMWVELSDGRTLGVPYAWFPRLLNATPKQREDGRNRTVRFALGRRSTRTSPSPGSWRVGAIKRRDLGRPTTQLDRSARERSRRLREGLRPPGISDSIQRRRQASGRPDDRLLLGSHPGVRAFHVSAERDGLEVRHARGGTTGCS